MNTAVSEVFIVIEELAQLLRQFVEGQLRPETVEVWIASTSWLGNNQLRRHIIGMLRELVRFTSRK